MRVKGVWYIKRDPYRTKLAKPIAWYTQPEHCYELIQASKVRSGNVEQNRGRTMWCCRHCNDFVSGKTDNPAVKIGHLGRIHRIKQQVQQPRGVEVDIGDDERGRIRPRQILHLPHVFVQRSFQAAVVSFVVICQISMSLMVTSLRNCFSSYTLQYLVSCPLQLTPFEYG